MNPLIWVPSIWIVVILLQGAFWPDLPFSTIHLALIHALYAWQYTYLWIAALVIAEWVFGGLPLGAAIGVFATIAAGFYLIHDDVNTKTPWLAGVIMIGIEFIRQFWLLLFGSLYKIEQVAHFPWGHAFWEALISVIVLTGILQYRELYRFQFQQR